MERQHVYIDPAWLDDYDPNSPEARKAISGKVVKKRYANLVSSVADTPDVAGELHAPVLDIDFEAKLVPSTTEGHYHLYLDRLMTWPVYENLLKALAEAGVIEKGYYKAAKQRKATLVRKPGVKKPDKAKKNL